MKKFSVNFLRRFVDEDANTIFEYFILVTILVNIITIGIETTAWGKMNSFPLFVIDSVCLGIFVVELFIKMIAFNKDFFKSNWNIFDLVIVLVSLFSTLQYFTVFRIFRGVRVLRALKSFRVLKTFKLVTSLHQIRKIVRAITLSFSGIVWTFFLLLIIYYVYGILGTNIFGSAYPEFFGSLPQSLYTLFQLMLMDDFGDITRGILEEFPFSGFYFISFTLITAFIIMNVIVGIVVDSIEEVHREDQKKSEKENHLEILHLIQEVKELKEEIRKSSSYKE